MHHSVNRCHDAVDAGIAQELLELHTDTFRRALQTFGVVPCNCSVIFDRYQVKFYRGASSIDGQYLHADSQSNGFEIHAQLKEGSLKTHHTLSPINGESHCSVTRPRRH